MAAAPHPQGLCSNPDFPSTRGAQSEPSSSRLTLGNHTGSRGRGRLRNLLELCLCHPSQAAPSPLLSQSQQTCCSSHQKKRRQASMDQHSPHAGSGSLHPTRPSFHSIRESGRGWGSRRPPRTQLGSDGAQSQNSGERRAQALKSPRGPCSSLSDALLRVRL